MPANVKPHRTPLAASDAEVFVAMAMQKREVADAGGDPLWQAQLRAEAQGLEGLAAALRDPSHHGVPAIYAGNGNEVTPKDDSDMPGRLREVAQAVTGSSGMLAADASLERLKLARDAGVLTLAVETAQDAGAETSIEKMLAHQIALAHQLNMGILNVANGYVQSYRSAPLLNTNAMTEAARSTHAAARLMDAFGRGALVLDRLRNGNRQTVIVQHTQVNEGGQAVVAGTVTTGSSTR